MYRRLTLIALALAFVVVVVGAYVRLSNAGLGCPDWPGCYGHPVPTALSDSLAQAKAWKEMVHRYLAGTLGVLILEPVIMAVVESAGGPLAHLPDFFFSRNVSALVNAGQAAGGSEQSFGGTTRTELPNAWQAAGVLAIYAAAFCGLAYWRFMKRDVQVG